VNKSKSILKNKIAVMISRNKNLELPEEAWSPIEGMCNLVVDLLTKDVAKLSGKFIHIIKILTN